MTAVMDSCAAAHRSRYGQRRFPRLVIAIAAVAMATSCIRLKNPPDVVALKNEAMPTVAVPPQWTGGGAAAGTVFDNWLAGFRDEQLTAIVAEAIEHNANLQVAAARVEQARLHAKLAGARLWPSVDLLAKGGGELSGDQSGIQGGVVVANWEIDL